MMTSWLSWKTTEEQIVELWIDGKIPYARACQLLPQRTASSVRRKGDILKAAGREGVAPGACERTQQDGDFCAAMLAAINAGLEHATVGIVKTPDTTEFRPTAFLPGVRSSGCSSSAALCADIAPYGSNR